MVILLLNPVNHKKPGYSCPLEYFPLVKALLSVPGELAPRLDPAHRLLGHVHPEARK